MGYACSTNERDEKCIDFIGQKTGKEDSIRKLWAQMVDNIKMDLRYRGGNFCTG
jgi:hypothetical protein